MKTVSPATKVLAAFCIVARGAVIELVVLLFPFLA
jgi:hypothetical protein